MKVDGIRYILTDIEGTTTSVSFVYDILFPYFRANMERIEELQDMPEVNLALQETRELVKQETGNELTSFLEISTVLKKWSLEDRKVTPLKTLQGVLWADGYKNGSIKGHIYSDVENAFKNWKQSGLQIGIFSSGSVAAQKLLFGFSEAGDLTGYLSHYFDTRTGGKRDAETYISIAKELNLLPAEILFLSDVMEELEAANSTGYQTIQLVRPGTACKWMSAVSDFSEIEIHNFN